MNVKEEVRIFLNKICIELGICEPFHNLENFAEESCNINEFVREIFMAEGLDSDLELKLFRQVKRMATNHFSSEFFD